MSFRWLTSVGLIVLWTAGCLDFVEPELPASLEPGPARLSVRMSLEENGAIWIGAFLDPGITAAGNRRKVLNDTLQVSGFRLAPDSSLTFNDAHSLVYEMTDTLRIDDPLVPGLEVQAPAVADVKAIAPGARWYGPRLLNPDTIVLKRDSALHVQVSSDLRAPEPQPQYQMWSLVIGSSKGRFAIDERGGPPREIVIPSALLPEADNGLLQLQYWYYVAGEQQAPPGDYHGVFTFSLAIRRTVVLTD